MTAIRFQVEPRDVPPEKAARRMGLTLGRFTELLPQLLSRGFPASDPDTGNYDLDAIDAWRAARHAGLRSQVNLSLRE
jgi:DNA-binding IclR family transcriptional regulator